MSSRYVEHGRFAVARLGLASRAGAVTLLLAIECSSHVASSEQTGELSSAVHGGAAVIPSTWSNVVALDET